MAELPLPLLPGRRLFEGGRTERYVTGEGGYIPVRPEPVEGTFMVRQAHHERIDKPVFSLSRGGHLFSAVSLYALFL